MLQLLNAIFNFQNISLIVSFLICYKCLDYFLHVVHSNRKLPPGPYGVPFVGYLPFIGDRPGRKFIQLSKQYGNTFTISLGDINAVIVNDWPTIKEVLSRDDFLGRRADPIGGVLLPNKSLIDMDGEEWRNDRRKSMKILRDSGLGKNSLEDKIRDEMSLLIEEIDKCYDDMEQVIAKIRKAPTNMICMLIYGYKTPDSVEMRRILDKFISFAIGSKLFRALVKLPLIVDIILKLGVTELYDLKVEVAVLEEIIKKEVEKRKQGFGINDRTANFIDGYIQTIETIDRDDIKQREDCFQTLMANIILLFNAGSETIFFTFSCTLWCLAKYPHFQQMIFNEIESKIGSNRQICFDDRMSMPFTQAFILEVHRFASILELNVPRKALKDTTLNGHSIPKDTMVWLNFYAVNYSPEYYKDPQSFNPDRFLSENKTQVIKPEYLVPFSAGKRNCPGERLADVELFLLLTNIVQNYRIEAPKDQSLDFNQTPGFFTRVTSIDKLIFKKR